MKDQHDKFEELADRLMENHRLDEPSFEFTSKVLEQLHQVKSSSSTVYKPLISRNIAFLGATFFFVLFSYLFYTGKIDLSAFTLMNSPLKIDLPKINYSILKISSSSIIMFALLIFSIVYGYHIFSISKMHEKSLQT